MFNETPRKNRKAFDFEGNDDMMNFEGPATGSTMCATATPGAQRKSDFEFEDIAPIRNVDFEEWDAPASPAARKNRFSYAIEDALAQAPTKNYENRRKYDFSPCDFNDRANLFDDAELQLKLVILRTPEKRSEVREFNAPEKPKVQLRYQNIEPIEFNLEKRAQFFSNDPMPCFEHLLESDSENADEVATYDIDEVASYNICNAPQKAKRNDYAFTEEDGMDLEFDMDATIFKGAPPISNLQFEFLLEDEEEVQTFEPSIIVSKQRVVPDFFKTQDAASIMSKTNLSEMCLSSPAIMSCTNVSSGNKYKLAQEKSMDGSISSAKRRSMLNTLSKKSNKV